MTFSDQTLFQSCIIIYYLIGLFTWFVQFPHSRYTNVRRGPAIHPSLGWFLLTSPSLWLTTFLFPFGQHAKNPKSWLLMFPYLLHYLHRVCIFPLRLRSTSFRGIEIIRVAILTGFNLINVYIQTRMISHYKDYDNDSWFWWRVFCGLLMFMWGLQMNVRADWYLTGLKGSKDGDYKIPEGGWFELVSCPNYLGELIEWLGWTVMTGSTVTLGFLFLSSAFLVRRARVNHKWYRKHKNYPKTRKALFPFLY